MKTGKNNGTFKKDVTLLLQEPYLLKRSVFENVAYGLRVRGKTEQIKKRVYETLQLVGLPPEKYAGRQWFELSCGESQRVALAARLVFRPEVLLLDEPTANVDQYSATIIKETIGRARSEYNATLIIVSHDLIWLNSVTDRIVKMYEGSIIGFGTDNLIKGPWNPDGDGMWKKSLPDGQKISVSNPPDVNATAILNPSNIMISIEYPKSISAQNILRGSIAHMSPEGEAGKVQTDVNVAGMPVTCSITRHAADALKLFPGKDVWVVFKASSLYWH